MLWKGLCITTILLCTSLVCGDRIILKNGDRLTGRVKQITGGQMIFETELAGTIKIQTSGIKEIVTDAPVEQHTTDGAVKIEPIEASTDLEQIKAVNPPVEKWPKWTGDITAGLTSSHGNTRSRDTNFRTKLQRITTHDKLTLSAETARSSQEDPDTEEDVVTEDWWKTRAKYEYSGAKKLSIYGKAAIESDSVSELDRRTILGGGFGYNWIESDKMNLSTEAGFAQLTETFDNKSKDNREHSIDLGYYFDKKINSKLSFINELSWYLSAQDTSSYLLSSTAELRASLTEDIFTNFRVILDYDSTPAKETKKTDVKYILGCGYNF